MTTHAKRLQGKVSIVTGASSGLGRAIALAYAQHGAVVVCADLREEARQEIADETTVTTHGLIAQGGGKASFVKTDVSSAADVENLIRATAELYGRVDIMVNNAGISLEAGRPPAKIHETSESVWDTTMAVNTKSVFLGCKYAIAQMLRQKPHECGDKGWIINMSSIFGLVGSYAASKGAVTNLTRQVACDYASDRIHCNAICPGYTQTAIFANTTKTLHGIESLNLQHPLKGVGQVSDIVGAAVFLASADANWITGVNLPVDGGYTMV